MSIVGGRWPVMDTGAISLFALGASRAFGEDIAQRLGIPLSGLEERDFDDGEHKCRAVDPVRGKDVYVIHSLYGDASQSVNDKLCRLLFFIGSLVDASAARVTAVVPYLCYMRGESRSRARDPVMTRYLARQFEAVGTHRIVAMDVHDIAAYQNAFRCQTEHLEARHLFVDDLLPLLHDQEVAVVSPDTGGTKRAERLRQALAQGLGRPVSSVFVEKHRSRMGDISGGAVVGQVRDCVAIIVDDLVSTGATLARAATACQEHGAAKVLALATHGVFSGSAQSALSTPALAQLVITDSIPPRSLSPELISSKLRVLGSGPLFAEAIASLHGGASVAGWLDD